VARELQTINSSGELNNHQLGGVNSTDKVLTSAEVDAKVKVTDDKLVDYVKKDGTVTITKELFEELIAAPAYANGNLYSKDGVLNYQGQYDDVTLQIGQEMHMEVINNTGVPILNGKAVTNNGVSGGIPQIKLAQADTFANAIILGVATHDIAHGSKGIITTGGVIHDLDTSTTTLGVPLYLSAIDAGDWVETPPDIVSQIGGALIQDASIGELFVNRRNNIVLPNVIGLLQKQATGGIYNLTAIAQNIENYATDGNIGVIVDLPNGTIQVPIDGFYSGSFSTTLSFTSVASTRTIHAEIYNIRKL